MAPDATFQFLFAYTLATINYEAISLLTMGQSFIVIAFTRIVMCKLYNTINPCVSANWLPVRKNW